MVERPMDEDLIASQNARRRATLDDEYDALGRMRSGGAIEPIETYRASGFRARKADERPAVPVAGGGIV
jgi:L-rhamnose isomerase/sugar isomerase